MDLSRFGPATILAVATTSMLTQQAFSYVCQIVMPILADRLAEEFGISPAWLGLYLFLQNVMSIIAAIGCGSFILRYGPMRVSQAALIFMGGSLLIVASGQLWLYPLGAMLLGAGSTSTPASSTILARVCPPRLVSLIFSVKQTGVPVGSLIGGLLLPFLLGLVFYSASVGTTIRLGPFGTALVTALLILLWQYPCSHFGPISMRKRIPHKKSALAICGPPWPWCSAIRPCATSPSPLLPLAACSRFFPAFSYSI
jgi:MFS family permease